MIITEHPWNGRNDRIRHCSDKNMMIRQNETGASYVEAIDVYPSRFTYTETDVPTEIPDDSAEQENFNE